MNPTQQTAEKFWKVAIGCVTILTLFILFLAINQARLFSQPLSVPAATDTITVSGEGDVFSQPDIATFDFSVTENAATVSDAQTAASTKTKAATDAMTAGGVLPADIQTTSYNINPHYDYTGGVCNGNGICSTSKSTLNGYDVSETVQVKVRDLNNAGKLLQAIGNLGVQNVDSLQFSIDKPDALQDQARSKAITDAQTKAQTLANELGVNLGKVVSFSENNGNIIVPMMYSTKAVGMTADSAAPAPTISTGQQKVASNVSITYEIR